MQTTHALNALLLGLLLIGSAWAYPRLPERIPVHFGVSGEADRWEERSVASWYLLPGLALALVGLNYGLARVLPRRPHLFNFPEKKQFLELPPERREPVIDRMQDFLYGLSIPLLLLFGFIQWTIYRTANGDDPQPYVLANLVIAVLMTPLLLVLWLPRIQREVRRQVREHREEGG
jgi:hypothetical protein